MSLAEYLVAEVMVEGRAVAEVAAAHGVSRSWLYELLARYREHGEAGLVARSRRPRVSPTRIGAGLEDAIVRWRKRLSEQGHDAGPATIAFHLALKYPVVPSEATIWRVLVRRGFVVRQPQKRPKSSFLRFAAELPNECWQADTTHWQLVDGTDVEILNILDDHSRLLTESQARRTFTAQSVVTVFRKAFSRWGKPSSVLTDNGAVFTATSRGGTCLLQAVLAENGITAKHSRPYHPQTCGKVERFHQTLKKWLTHQPAARTLAELQAQLDTFRRYYNIRRPHRALGRHTPAQAWQAKAKATPTGPKIRTGADHRIRHDKIDKTGCITLRYRSKLHHIGLGRAHAGTRVRIHTHDRDVRILTLTGQLLRELVLDPNRDYQPRGKT